VASNYPDDGRPARLPFRGGGPGEPAYAEARAEVRDRETYYAELRFAVHCQSRSLPAPRAALDDLGADSWPHRSTTGSTDAESWDEIVARFGDTWT
jgi:hypothetical protein